VHLLLLGYSNDLPKTVKLKRLCVVAASPSRSVNTVAVFIVPVDIQLSDEHACPLLLIYTSSSRLMTVRNINSVP
jgi:hypothetical protein